MIEISICIGSACHLKGSYNVVQTFQQLVEEHALHDHIELKATFCMKQCQNKGVSVRVGDASYSVVPETAQSFFDATVLPLVQHA